MPNSKQNTAQAARGQYARSHDTRARILSAALAEASEAGLANTSVARIASRADVAVGILNYHFGSKKELLRELMASQVQDFLSRLTPPEVGDDFFSYEENLLLTYLDFLHANPTYVRLAEEVRLHDPQLYRDGTSAHVAHLCSRLQGGVARGELRPMSKDEIRAQAYFLLGAFTFLDRFVEDTDYPGDASVASSFISTIRRSLAA